jgi:hypothetical protein
MTKEQLRREFSRLSKCSTIDDCKDMLDIYAEFLFMGVQNHHDEAIYSHAEADAKIVFQMMFTKVLHLKRAIEGISYESKDGLKLNEIIDPTIVAALIRNIYETVAMFNLIYRDTQSNEQREMLYLLWVHSGLKYRQRFVSIIRTEKSKKKQEHEKTQIDDIVEKIESSALFQSLDNKNQEKIKRKLMDKDYLMKFENGEVIFLHWHDLSRVMGVKRGLLDHIYSYFSLYSHPSNVSVFQFAEMFERGIEAYPGMVSFNLRCSFILISVFIADYINLFPNCLSSFESLELKEQIAINAFNVFSRGQDYSINGSLESLE